MFFFSFTPICLSSNILYFITQVFGLLHIITYLLNIKFQFPKTFFNKKKIYAKVLCFYTTKFLVFFPAAGENVDFSFFYFFSFSTLMVFSYTLFPLPIVFMHYGDFLVQPFLFPHLYGFLLFITDFSNCMKIENNKKIKRHNVMLSVKKKNYSNLMQFYYFKQQRTTKTNGKMQ